MMQHVASSPCRAKAITHTPGSFFLELRQDYIALCMACGYTKSTETRKSKASPHCKALILSVLEHWTDCKPEGEPIFMALSQWIDSLYGMYCRNVIIDSLEELTGEGLITREGYKTQGGEMYGYHLCVSEINKRLTGLQINQLKSKPKRLKSKPLQAESGELVNSKRLKSKHFIDTNIDSKDIDSEREESCDASANASDITSAPSFSSEEKAEPREETPPQQTEAHPIATAPVQPTQDMLLPEASHPLSEDEWLTLRGRCEQQVHARWKECQPKQGIRAAHATFAAFKKSEMRAWDLRTPKPQKNVTDALWGQLTPAEIEGVKRWFSLRRGAVITPIDVTGAHLLTESGIELTPEQMRKERDWLRTTQPKWYGFQGTKRGSVNYKDIAEHAADWLEAVEEEERRTNPPANGNSSTPGTVAPLLKFRSATEADDLEARKQRIRDAERRKQQPPQNVTPVDAYQSRKVAHA